MVSSEKNKIGIHCILAAAYFLMLPLTIATNETSSSLLKLATIPIGFFFVVSMVFYRKEFKINIIHLLLALYTVVSFLALSISFNVVTLDYMFGYCLNAVLFLCISVIEYNPRELKLLEDIQILLLIIVTAIPLFGELPDGHRTELVIFGQRSDPNYFTGFFVFPLAVAMKKICESKWRLVYVALVAVSLYVILLSGSRGGLLAIMATGIAFALIYPKGLTKKFLAFGTIVVCAVIFWIMILPYLPENIAARFSVQEVIESRGTYRGDIWVSMIEEIKASDWEIVFGRGLDAMHSITLDGKLYRVGAHNHLIQLMYTQGLIGLTCFVVLIIACIARCAKKRKTVAVAIIGMMALSMSLSFNTSTKTFWNLIPYAAFAFTDIGDRKKDIPDETEIEEKEETKKIEETSEIQETEELKSKDSETVFSETKEDDFDEC